MIEKLNNVHNSWNAVVKKINEIIDNGGGGGGGGFEPTQQQLDAMNSGATAQKINQITINKNEIADKVDKETGKSLVLDSDIGQITTNKNDILLKQDKLTDDTDYGDEPLITDTLSNVNLSTKKVKKITFLNLLSWVKNRVFEWVATTISDESTDNEIASAYSVWKLKEQTKKYLHYFKLYNNANKEVLMYWFGIVDKNPTMTFAQMKQWLITNGFTSTTNPYGLFGGGCTGTTAVRNSADSGTTYVGRVFSGMFVENDLVWAKYDYNGTRETTEDRCLIENISFTD